MLVEAVGPEEQAPVDGEALGFVDGERVAVAEVSGVEILRRKRVLGVLVGADRDGPRVGADGGDRGAGAVTDAEFAIVAEADDAVACLIVGVVDREDGAVEGSVGLEMSPGSDVEVVDVMVVMGDHERVVAGEGGGIPISSELVPHVDRGRRVHDSVVKPVAVERGVDVPSAQLAERLAFPEFCLASVLSEGDRFGADGEAVEEPARVDRVQLFRVADEHDLRVSVMRGVEEHGELASASHGCLVHDEDGSCIEAQVSFLELEDPKRDCVRSNDRFGFGVARRRSRRAQRRSRCSRNGARRPRRRRD